MWWTPNGHKQGTFEEERMVIDKFSSSGKYIGQITQNPDGEFPQAGFRELFGVAVDASGEVWVEEQNFGAAHRKAPPITQTRWRTNGAAALSARKTPPRTDPPRASRWTPKTTYTCTTRARSSTAWRSSARQAR